MPQGRALVWLSGDDPPRIVRVKGYFDIPKLNARASPNPYYRGGKPKPAKTTVWFGAAGLAGALAFTFGTHIPGPDAGHVMAEPVHRSKPHQPVLAKAGAARPHAQHHARHRAHPHTPHHPKHRS